MFKFNDRKFVVKHHPHYGCNILPIFLFQNFYLSRYIYIYVTSTSISGADKFAGGLRSYAAPTTNPLFKKEFIPKKTIMSHRRLESFEKNMQETALDMSTLSSGSAGSGAGFTTASYEKSARPFLNTDFELGTKPILGNRFVQPVRGAGGGLSSKTMTVGLDRSKFPLLFPDRGAAAEREQQQNEMVTVDESTGESVAIRFKKKGQQSSDNASRIQTGTRSMIVSIPEDEALLTEADIIRRNAVSQVKEDERDMVSLLKQMPHQDLTSSSSSRKKSAKASSKKSAGSGAITDAEIDHIVSGDAIDFVLNGMDLSLEMDSNARTSEATVASISTDERTSSASKNSKSSSSTSSSGKMNVDEMIAQHRRRLTRKIDSSYKTEVEAVPAKTKKKLFNNPTAQALRMDARRTYSNMKPVKYGFNESAVTSYKDRIIAQKYKMNGGVVAMMQRMDNENNARNSVNSVGSPDVSLIDNGVILEDAALRNSEVSVDVDGVVGAVGVDEDGEEGNIHDESADTDADVENDDMSNNGNNVSEIMEKIDMPVKKQATVRFSKMDSVVSGGCDSTNVSVISSEAASRARKSAW